MSTAATNDPDRHDPHPDREAPFHTMAASRAELRAAAIAAAQHVRRQGHDDALLMKAIVRKSYPEARAALRARRQRGIGELA